MELTVDQLRGPAQVSSPAEQFLEFVEGRPHLLERASFGQLFRSARELVPTLSGVEAGSDYGLQPWPVLITAERRRDLERAGVGLTRLVRDLPRRFFANDPRAVAEFYGLETELMAALLLSAPSFLGQTLGRGDFIDGPDGLKCLELNFGNIGGWQHCAYAPLYLEHPEIAAFSARSGLELDWRNSIRTLLRHVVRDSVRRLRPAGGELNLLMVASEGGNTSLDTHPVTLYRREYEIVLGQLAPGWHGQLTVARASDLEIDDGRLLVGGTRFHAVIEQNEEPSREIFRCAKAGRVFCYTGLVGMMILGDKRNLALLSEHQDSPLFSPEEQQLIADFVPWTRHLRKGEIDFGGSRLGVRDLLRSHQQELVIKAGFGFAGYQVIVGRFVDDETWQRRAEAALDEGGWVVQEYLAPRPQTFQQGEVGAGPYDVVWGVYVFGDSYGGLFLRMAPRGSMAAVNVSQGGRIGVVFEARRRDD